MRTSFLLLITLLLLGALPTTSSSQTVSRVLTKGGETYQGEIVTETADTITLRSESGSSIAIPRSSIARLDYEFDPIGRENHPFWAFGATLGTPAGLNLVLGYNFNNDWGLRFSGGYIGTAAGLQIDGLYRLGGDGARHNLHFGLGSSIIDHHEWSYFVGGYNLQVGGFDLMGGLSVGSGDYTNPQILLQIGYVHRFRD